MKRSTMRCVASPPGLYRASACQRRPAAQGSRVAGAGPGMPRYHRCAWVSKSSVSLWVRDMPRSARLSREECAKRQADAVAAYWAAERPRREAVRQAIRADAAERIGLLTERDVLVAGAIAYWCEGSKSKPYRLSNPVIFINSDPQLIKFFLRLLWLSRSAHDRSRLSP